MERCVMADQGADSDVISASLLKEIPQKPEGIKREVLIPPHIYLGVKGEPSLTCHEAVKFDISLQIRHDSSLLLRKIMWKVTVEKLPTPIICRRIWGAFGCDNRQMLITAWDRFRKDIDLTQCLADDGKEEENEGQVAALFEESAFHNSGRIEADWKIKNDIYVDRGNDPREDMEKEVKHRAEEADKTVCQRMERNS